MPYLQANIPLRGWTTDVPFSTVPDGFSHDLFNVIPTDPFRRRVRLGTRPGLNRTYKFASGTAVQCLVRCVAFNGVPPTKRDRVIVVNAGKIYYMDPGGDPQQVLDSAGGAGAANAVLNTNGGRVEGVQRGQYVYLVDGSNYVKVDLFASPPVWSYWHHGSAGPEDHVTNTISGVTYTATLIALYGSRLVLAGVRRLENVWFMSNIEDPDDWSPSASASDALAGNDGNYGVPGDEIVALVPFGQTGIMFAGNKSISYLNFDPAIDSTQTALRQISRSVGIVGPRAWCYGPERTVYLLSQDGLYRLSPNDFNIDRGSRISLNKIDSFFASTKWEDINASLAYDVERRGVWIFLTRTDTPSASTHLFYSEQTDGFFPWRSYDPNFFGAFSTCQMLTTDGRAQIQLFGSSGGQLSYFDQKVIAGIDGYVAPGYPTDRNPSVAESQQQKIESKVTFGPITSNQPGLVMVKEVQVELGADEYLADINVKGDADKPIVTLLSAATSQEAVSTAINSVLITELETIAPDGGNASGAGGGTGSYNGGDRDDVSTPPTTYLDGQYAYPVEQTYTTQDTFVDPLDRIWLTDNGRYELIRVDFSGTMKWVIQDEDTTRPLFVQQAVNGTYSEDPSVGEYYYVITNDALAIVDTLDGTGQDKVSVRVQAGQYSGLTTTELGNVTEGINNRMRCRVRAESIFMRMESDGYPFAIERIGVDVSSAGIRRGVADIP
jgi:hypothetical protein